MKRRNFLKQTLGWLAVPAVLTRLPVVPRPEEWRKHFATRGAYDRHQAEVKTWKESSYSLGWRYEHPRVYRRVTQDYEYRWVPDTRNWRVIAQKEGYERALNIEPRDNMVCIRRQTLV